jgi:flagellar hook protein FlgE
VNSSFYNSIVGVKTHQTGLDIVSNNIANDKTPGYRAYRAEFANYFSTAYAETSQNSTVDSQKGYGSYVNAASMTSKQGALEITDRNLDLAIEGDGWFGVKNHAGEINYTRNGTFMLDAGVEGNEGGRLVDTQGNFVLGTMVGNITAGDPPVLSDQVYNVNMTTPEAQAPITLPTLLTYPAEPTTFVKMIGNLGFQTTANTVEINEIDPITGVSTVVGEREKRTAQAQVIDKNGDKNTMHVTFTRDSRTQPTNGILWDIEFTITDTPYINIPGTDDYKDTKQTSVIYDQQTSQLTFNEFGSQVSNTTKALNNNGTSVTIDFGSGFEGLVSTDSPNTNIDLFHDGYPGSTLDRYEVDLNGAIIATFANGQQSAVGQIPIYHFRNDGGLNRTSESMFAQSENSGEPYFMTGQQGEYIIGGKLRTGALEMSNVSLATSLTNMIIMQRAFDANAKGITTSDDLIQTAIQMKR